jgi:multiple antibiotic resistance protein
MIEYTLAITAAIFSIANPLGAIPLYLSLSEDYDSRHRLRTSINVALFCLGILMIFFWSGIHILDFFGINVNALRIAGGLVILNSGVGLLSGKMETSKSVDKRVRQEMEDMEDISFTPMAMPMIAGPGAISYLINLYSSTESNTQRLGASVAIIIMAVLVFLVLRFSPLLYRLLGRVGLRALSRIMGFLVMAIGTQYIIQGVVLLVQQL